jgi:hypothetical protein
MGRGLALSLFVITSCLAGMVSSPARAERPHTDARIVQHRTTYSHTRSVVKAFIHAYNTHELRTVMSLFVPTAQYSDCDWVHQTLRIAVGHKDVQRLIQREFADNQRIVQPTITTANPRQRYVAELDFLQASESMQRHGFAPYASGYKIVLETADYKRIDHMVGEGANGCHR